MSILDVQVSTYRSTKDLTGTPQSLLTWLTTTKYRKQVEAIRREPDPQRRKALKAAMPCATISGTFTPGQRNDKGLVQHSGFICLDIDAKANTHVTNWDNLAEQLAHVEHFAYVGLSVSGSGYMAIAAIQCPSLHKQHYRALAADLRAYGVVVDPTCLNPSRVRYYSYDAGAYFNPDAIRYEGLPAAAPSGTYGGGGGGSEGVNPDRERAKVRAIVEEIERTGVDLTGSYGDWFGLARALVNTFPEEEGRGYYQRLSANYPDYDPEQTDREYSKALESRGRATIATLYALAKAHNLKYKFIQAKQQFSI